MNSVKIVLNGGGIKSLLQSAEMQNILRSHANDIARTSGGEVDVYVASTRAVAEVTGDDGNNGLLKAVGGKK